MHQIKEITRENTLFLIFSKMDEKVTKTDKSVWFMFLLYYYHEIYIINKYNKLLSWYNINRKNK